MDRRRQRIITVLLLFAVTIVLYRSFIGTDAVRHAGQGLAGSAFSSQGEEKGLKAANATLGFGAIVAVSREGSPRREGLILASNITEIDITIPIQPKWTEEQVEELRADRDSRINRGSALAWLGHLNALRWFLASDLETMLVLEDDVDWDIHLRTIQIPQAATAIRKLVAEKTDPPGSLSYNTATGENFWGNHTAWDLLYLGHCGDIFRPSTWTPQNPPRLTYEDPTLPPLREMHPYTTKFLESIGIGEHTRIIHQSIFPLCTFGFAMTRPAAQRLLTDIAPKEAEGGTMAYDVRVLEGCRDHGLRCWSANPELFHHMDSESEIAQVNDSPISDSEEKKNVGADEEGRLKVLRMGKAPNIRCGARSKDFFTRDEKTMQYLRQKVGREGVCLRDGEEEERKNSPETGEKYEGPGDPRMYI